jgi:[ribosomal protein S5]-alanine N-acetyltransferase
MLTGRPMAPLRTERLALEPLVAAHAEPMYELLQDPAIYPHLDWGPPPSLEQLRSVYGQLEARRSPDGAEGWLNWVVKTPDGRCIGYVQATVTQAACWVAYVLGSAYRGRGYAREATAAMMRHVAGELGTRRFLATVEAANRPSIGLLKALGFRCATPAEAAPHELSGTEELWVREAFRGGDE